MLAFVRRALVTKLRHHGDVLLASPVFTVLKGALPGGGNRRAGLSPRPCRCSEDHPAISRIHAIDRDCQAQGMHQSCASRARLLLGATRSADTIFSVHLTEHPRGAWLARLLRPRYSVARELERAHWLWRKSFTHYYRLPRSTPRHTGRMQSRRLAPHRHAADLGGEGAGAGPGDAATPRARALLEQHGVAVEALRPAASGIALAVQVLAAWNAMRSSPIGWPKAAGGSRLPARPIRDERRLVDAIVAADRALHAPSVWST